jgi:tripartite-type tricarboxylate transporter receptor subunit TctC
VMTGEVTMGFFNTPTVIGQIKEGKVKALGVTSLKRSPLLPLVPTLDELGIAGYEVNTWFGFVAPARTPQEIVARLNVELTRIFASAEAREKLGPQGFDLAPPMAPAMFAKLISDDLATWVPIVKASGATAN